MLICLCLMACKDNNPQTRQKAINDYANTLMDDPFSFDKSKADTFINMANAYIKDFPQDSMSELYLFQISQVYANEKNCDSALYYLDQMIKLYPKGKKIGAAYFFKAVYLKEVCLNTELSTKAFEQYIKLFPNSKQIQAAKRLMQIDTINKPETIIDDTNTNNHN